MVFYIYIGDRLIGKDYTTDSGEWLHRWIDSKTNCFERGSWRGRCNGDSKDKWRYEERREDIMEEREKQNTTGTLQNGNTTS